MSDLNKKTEDEKIDDIIAMLDDVFAKGSERASLKIENIDGDLQVQTVKLAPECKGANCTIENKEPFTE